MLAGRSRLSGILDGSVGQLNDCWQMPLYALDMKCKVAERSALEEEQERMLWAEIGVTNEV